MMQNISRMWKNLGILILFLFSFHTISAQGYNPSLMQQLKNATVRLQLKDASNEEPVPFASVYLVPQGDTTIVDFTLSEKDGTVIFRNVPLGRYVLNVEMMGYEPFRKNYHFRTRREELGTVRLEVNSEFLQSATISAAANPIRIVKDTIEFNASSFRVSENAMLEDLLKKMPGIEIENGNVKMNGEQVNKITVGGKTFFFDDSNAALKNLPAKIVEKIKVIDRDKEEAAFSGVATKDDREKILDVGLKKQFQKGWFGNVKGNGGMTVVDAEKDQRGESLIQEGPVYNANVMVSGYSDKDQLVMIGNLYNVDSPELTAQMKGMTQLRSAGASNDFSKLKGILSSGMAGVNYNTQRIRGLETTTSFNYNHSQKEGREKSFRTSFQPDASAYQTQSSYHGTGYEDGITLNLEMKNTDRRKYFFHLAPQISFNRNHVSSMNLSSTEDGQQETAQLLNSNENRTSSTTHLFNHGLSFRGGIRQLGKERRSIRLNLNYSYGLNEGYGSEYTLLKTFRPETGKETLDPDTPKETLKDLSYHSDGNDLHLSAGLNYVEPLGGNWLMEASFRSTYNQSRQTKDATDPDGTANDYYSTASHSRFFNEVGRLVAQFDNDTLSFQLGVQATATQNENRSKSMGQDITSGKGEWNMNYSPFANMKYMKGDHRFYFYYTGMASQVSGKKIMPILNFTNPLHISAGNVFLKPSFRHYASADYSFNSRKSFTFLRSGLNSHLGFNEMVDAIWFDENGVRYAIPVNSQKPELDVDWNFMFNQPFGAEKHFTFSGHFSVGAKRNVSYQATSQLPGLDIDQFDYNQFMNDFWGDASGNRFYGGESGFQESRTNSLNWTTRISMKYTNDFLDLAVGGHISNQVSHYSLDQQANTDIWRYRVFLNTLWQLGKGWEIDSRLSYRFYQGYTDGYGEPECQWNMSISKNIKAFTLSLSGIDLLNQRKNLRHVVSNDYIEDSYTNVVGRHLLFGIAYNFGKKDGKRNSNAARAMRRIM